MVLRQQDAPQLHIYLLGTFRIEQAGSLVHLPTRKAESLLAYLVLHPGFHSREKLATLFWGDSSDTAARGSLRKAVNFIRSRLGSEIIISNRELVQRNPDYLLYCDAIEFANHASEILSSQSPDSNRIDLDLYQDELLSGFYDDWILDEREHYHQLYVKVLLRAVETLRAQSEYNTAIQYASKLLIRESTNEQAYQHLIFCHVALGDRNGALQEYEACRKVMETELGVKPARETRALYEWITQTSDIRSLAARVTNLPIPISSFVGRGRELAEIRRLLSTARLVTLTGVGGSGKTRLVVRVATELLDSFHHGVWWVDLSSLVDENLVLGSVAKSLGIKESQQQRSIESMINFLQPKALLLVIDNCEHLVEACAQLVTSLLTQCPQLKILATSREALRVDGEIVYNVPTLQVPKTDKNSIADLLLEFESVKLFVARARAIQSNFALDDRTALLVAQICARLDGIPLAIELAAARVKTMTVVQIVTNLDDAFRLLIGGSRAALPRQQTLRAMIDWSYGLLSEQEKTLFRRLAVFVGGSSLEAVEEICGGDGIERKHVYDGLSQLAHKSMLVTEHNHGGVRFYMLETIRQYAQEKLSESLETETMSNRHLDFFAVFAESIQLKLKTTERITHKKRLEIEHDNLRAALRWSLEGSSRARVEMGARIACALEPFWKYQGYYREGRSWLDKSLLLLDASEFSSTPLYAKALYSAGHLATFQEDFTRALLLLEKSVALYRSMEPLDIRSLAAALTMLAMATPFENIDLAYGWSEEAVRLCLTLGPEGTPDLARSLFWAGNFAYQKGDYSRAQSYAEQSQALWQQTDYVGEAAAPLSTLGHIALRRQDYFSARTYYEQSLRLWQAAEDGWAIAASISWLGDLERIVGNYAEASRRYQESLKMWKDMGIEQQVGLDLRDLALVEMHQGHYEHARKLLKESLSLLKLFRDDPSKDTSIALNLAGLSEIARKQNQPSLAARLLGAAEAMAGSAGDQSSRVRFDTFGFTMGFGSMDEFERLTAAGHQELDEAAWLEGQAMSVDQTIQHALELE